MDFTLYNLIIEPLNPRPDLAVIQNREIIPEDWPVVLEKIQIYRKQVQYFTVSDGQTSIVCTSTVPDLYDRIAATELGTIIHLLGTVPVYCEQRRNYILSIEDFLTLKQYDEHLKSIRAAEEQRRQALIDQDDAYYESLYGVE